MTERRCKRALARTAALLALSIALSACASSSGPSQDGTSEAAASSGPLPKSALARVGGEVIGPKEMAHTLRALCAAGALEPAVLGDPAQLKPTLKPVLELMVYNRVALLAATEAGEAREVDDQAWAQQNRALSPERYIERVGACGTTRATVKAHLSEALTAAAFYERQGQQLGVAEVRAGYALDRGRPPVDQLLMLRVIQVDLAKRGREAAATRAQELRAMLALGANFEAVSRDHSDHPNAARGGELGRFFSTDLAPVVRAAVSATPVGQISPVVPLPTGFMIFKVDARGWDVSGALNTSLQEHYQAMNAGRQAALQKSLEARFKVTSDPARLGDMDIGAALKATAVTP